MSENNSICEKEENVSELSSFIYNQKKLIYQIIIIFNKNNDITRNTLLKLNNLNIVNNNKILNKEKDKDEKQILINF